MKAIVAKTELRMAKSVFLISRLTRMRQGCIYWDQRGGWNINADFEQTAERKTYETRH